MCQTPLSLLFMKFVSMVSMWYYSHCARLPCHLVGVSEGRMLKMTKTEVVSNGMVLEISFVKTVLLVSVTWPFKCSYLSFHLQLPVVLMNTAHVSQENFLPTFCKFIDCFCAGNVAVYYMATTLYLRVCVCMNAMCLIQFSFLYDLL